MFTNCHSFRHVLLVDVLGITLQIVQRKLQRVLYVITVAPLSTSQESVEVKRPETDQTICHMQLVSFALKMDIYQRPAPKMQKGYILMVVVAKYANLLFI